MSSTRGLWLSTRFRRGAYEGESCLLVYDDEPFDDMLVSRDVKEVFEQRANTSDIYIAAPVVPSAQVIAALSQGAAVQRAMPYLCGVGSVFVLGLQRTAPGSGKVMCTSVAWKDGELIAGPAVPLPSELREGWLFDLFHKNQGLVTAPVGVHFKKGSGKHSTKFLRSANVLTSSAACALIAMFAIEKIDLAEPRRIFVDTSPLISVALSLGRVANIHGLWPGDLHVRSFGSYGGLENIRRLSHNDIVLISASTSGALTSELESRGGRGASMVTLYFLASGPAVPVSTQLLCDLTVRPDRTFGYPFVENHIAIGCPLCAGGDIAADLEGDQFLLQQRQTKLLKVIKGSQADSARDALEKLARLRLIRIALRPQHDQPMSLSIVGDDLLDHERIRPLLLRHLHRFCPVPLNVVVRVGVSEGAVSRLMVDAGLKSLLERLTIVDWPSLHDLPAVHQRGALVVFGSLDNHARARYINATMRRIGPGGAVTYLAPLTLAQTPEHLGDLKRFLQYGEQGPDTFTFRSVLELAYPENGGEESSWSAELLLLQRLVASDPGAPTELKERLNWLEGNSIAEHGLFWPGRGMALEIQNDYVFLSTSQNRTAISQADVFATIANALCSARNDNRPLSSASSQAGYWHQTVYGHVLLSPSNFEKFNDPILRAAFLRAAHKQELLYSVDEYQSEQIKNIVLAEVGSWKMGAGDALPEMLVALATKRLTLNERHVVGVRNACIAATLPSYLKKLAEAMLP